MKHAAADRGQRSAPHVGIVPGFATTRSGHVMLMTSRSNIEDLLLAIASLGPLVSSLGISPGNFGEEIDCGLAPKRHYSLRSPQLFRESRKAESWAFERKLPNENADHASGSTIQ